MATPHRVGDEAEFRDRAPLPLKIERHRIAIFHHDGQFRAISDICNHRGPATRAELPKFTPR